MRVMEGESDRGCLLVGLSLVDDALERMLSHILSSSGGAADAEWLLDAKPGGRPLASLAVRTRLAVCLGLLSEEKRKLIDAFRRMRNAHAHGVEPFILTAENLKPITDAWPEDTHAAFPFFEVKDMPWDLSKPKECLSLALSAVAVDIQIRTLSFSLPSMRVTVNALVSTIKKDPALMSGKVGTCVMAVEQAVDQLARDIESVTGPYKGDDSGVN